MVIGLFYSRNPGADKWRVKARNGRAEVSEMPKALERKLKKQAREKKLKGERANAYVYGTMEEKTDWKPGRKKGGKPK